LLIFVAREQKGEVEEKRSRAAVARQFHSLEVVGSNPTSAPKIKVNRVTWVKDTRWIKLDTPKRCRSIAGSPRVHCPNMADYGLIRSNGVWAYCEQHMYGRRIRDGIVEFEVSDNSPAAERGYV
jgi:hypothetical protein